MKNQCTKCHQFYPATVEYFPAAPRKDSGLSSWCRPCHRANVRRWSSSHKDENKERCRDYYHAHKSEAKVYKAVAYKENKDQRLAHNKAYRDAHPDKMKNQYRTYYQNNQSSRIAYVLQWRRDNPEKHAEHKRIRRARKANAPVNDFTAEQWQSMQRHYEYRCVYCGCQPEKLTQDHITPLSKGGSHTYTNIVPACISCNCKKSAGDILSPVQPLLLLPNEPLKRS